MLQQDLEQLDHFIAAVSNNIIRLREIRDIFIISIREKKRMIKIRQNTLTSRKRIYNIQDPDDRGLNTSVSLRTSPQKRTSEAATKKMSTKGMTKVNPLTGFSFKQTPYDNPYNGGPYKPK